MTLSFEYQVSNGMWLPLDPQELPWRLAQALKQEAIIAEHLGCRAATQADELMARLERGERLSTGPDWYDQIRRKPAARPPVPARRIKADCGHWVAKGSVMMASLGTSCPECYDNLSA